MAGGIAVYVLRVARLRYHCSWIQGKCAKAISPYRVSHLQRCDRHHATLFPWPGVGVAVCGHYFRHRVLDYQTADGYCVWSFNWRDEYGAIPPTRFHSVCGFPLRGAVCGYWRTALAAVWLDFCRLLHLPSHSGFGADPSDYAFANRTSPGYRVLGVGALGLCVGLYRTDYRFASHFAAHFVLQRVYPPCA